ncbi:hypothetical protein [Aeromicrobium sp. REDSEA-S32_B7]|uniref:hypothetical protein n=1 Tax=Aeromicrobium sp. REDSEA-S32_B7 TaxID=1811526 RepID=UPI000A463F7F|nr:hypothetical protein [Aeromicrobium sp. REDSEA-S32_B7]
MTAAHAATGLSSRGPHRCLALTFVLGALLTASTVSVSMVPDLHFDGWRWVLAGVAVLAAALAVPVHREAAAELARRRLGPGVLGSLGLVVALAATVVETFVDATPTMAVAVVASAALLSVVLRWRGQQSLVDLPSAVTVVVTVGAVAAGAGWGVADSPERGLLVAAAGRRRPPRHRAAEPDRRRRGRCRRRRPARQGRHRHHRGPPGHVGRPRRARPRPQPALVRRRPAARARRPGRPGDLPTLRPRPGHRGAEPWRRGRLRSVDARVLGTLTVGDDVRPDAAEGVQALRDLGLDVALRSSDTDARTREVGLQVGVVDAAGDVDAAGQEADVETRSREGQRVLHVAPSTTLADDLGLPDLDVLRVATALRASRSAVRAARRGLVVALTCSAVAGALAAGGLLGPGLASVAAGLSAGVTALSSGSRTVS